MMPARNGNTLDNYAVWGNVEQNWYALTTSKNDEPQPQPTAQKVYGDLLIKLAATKGWSVYTDGWTYQYTKSGYWRSSDFSNIGVNGQEVVEALNSMEYCWPKWTGNYQDETPIIFGP